MNSQYFLVTIHGNAPEGGTIDADTPVEIRRVEVPNNNLGEPVYDNMQLAPNDPVPFGTTFAQLENTLCEESA